MALPLVNEVPEYDLTIPSTQQHIKFRPFLVKEQKILLIALESQNQKNILDAIVNTIKACVLDDIKVRELAVFDVEYMFTQIRAKSVGETSNVVISCSHDGCDIETEIKIPLETIKVEVNEKPPTIDLNSQYRLKLKYPRYEHMLRAQESEDLKGAELLYHMTLGCLEALQTDEANILFADEGEEETKTFLENLNTDQFNKIMEFVETVPSLKHEVVFNCAGCGKENKYTLQGINDFF